jgi:hypothetical protein
LKVVRGDGGCLDVENGLNLSRCLDVSMSRCLDVSMSRCLDVSPGRDVAGVSTIVCLYG